ncbi:hypothetical protein D3C86_2126470 [compost metagenome]
MAADHGDIGGTAAGHIEPGHDAVWRAARTFLGFQIHDPVRGTEAETGEGVHDHAMAVDAGQVA